jgi:hypothetical protein
MLIRRLQPQLLFGPMDGSGRSSDLGATWLRESGEGLSLEKFWLLRP